MKLCVIGGAGYVGLITGIGFAKLGHTVVNVDIDCEKIGSLGAGISPIYEEGLQIELEACLSSKRLSFTTDMITAVKNSEVIFVAVGSPDGESGVDMSQITQVFDDLAESCNAQSIVVIKSTVPIGTVDMIQNRLNSRTPGDVPPLVINPEFLREGQGLYDFFHPHRIVIGTDSDLARAKMRELYAPFTSKSDQRSTHIGMASEVPILETSAVNAQVIKYGSNAFLATRVSFVNELAGICEEAGADITEVALGLGYDDRIGWNYMTAGVGFGGPCLEKDLKALIDFGVASGYDPILLKAVLERNNKQVERIIGKISELIDQQFKESRICILGLTFKPGTNDVRTSISLRVIEEILKMGSNVVAHDPEGISDARKLCPDIRYTSDPYQALEGADVLVLLTDWPEYCALDFEKIAQLMNNKNVVDGRNLFDRAMLRRLKFHFRTVGWASS